MAEIPREGDTPALHSRENRLVWLVLSMEVWQMLQWKPRLFALMAVLALIAAALGQFTWHGEQFTWL